MEINFNLNKDMGSITTLLSTLLENIDNYTKEQDINKKLHYEKLVNNLHKESIKYIDTLIREFLVYKINKREVLPPNCVEILKQHFSNRRYIHQAELQVQPDSCIILFNLLNKLVFVDKDLVKIILSIL